MASTSVAMSDWLIGMIPPSAMPISRRVPSSIAKDEAKPEPNEQSEKASVERISRRLRDPNRSARTPMPNAASAQVSESAPASKPTCVLFSARSGWMNGIRKLERIPVEQDDAEIQAEQRRQRDLIPCPARRRP